MTPEEHQDFLNKIGQQAQSDLCNLMAEYALLRQKYDRLLAEFYLDVSAYDTQQAIERATNA